MRHGLLEWLFKTYDDTGIDKGSWHTKQFLVDLIQSGGITIINYLQNFIQHSSLKVISSKR
jgi:hypothetical protein